MGGKLHTCMRPPPPDNTLNVIAVTSAAGRASRRYTSSRGLESDYKLDAKVVGSGLSGPVRLATARVGGQKVAVKSFNKNGLSAQRLVELKSEAEIYLSLDHPHVARLEMVYETAVEANLVMEYMEGGELYDRLAEKKQYTETAAAEASHQMLLAVAYLHAHGIAHRDLKLENFLYESKDTNILKVIDFGFAKFVDHNTEMSQACGSIHYVAPEVLAHSYTEKADLWSMGVIIFMLLTGSPPFFGTEEEVLQKIRGAKVHWSSRFRRLSGPAQSFLQALFAPKPALRPSAQEALEHPWLRCRSHAQGTVIDVGILNNLRSFARASQLRRNVLYMMAWSTSSEDRSQLRDQFLAIDHNNTGIVKLRDFKAVLEEQLHIDAEEAEALFRSLDADNSDEIEYSEFLAAALLGHVKVHEGVLRKTFARLDTNGDGTIDREELAGVIGESFSAFEIDELIREVDKSGDGKLDYEDFLAYFHKPEVESGTRTESKRKTRRWNTEKLSNVIDSIITLEGEGMPVTGSLSDHTSHLSRQKDKAGKRRFKTVPSRSLTPLPILLGREVRECEQ